MYLPEIKESGNFQIKEIKFYPKRRYEPGRNFYTPGYFGLILKCKENKIAKEVRITFFEGELEKLIEFKEKGGLI